MDDLVKRLNALQVASCNCGVKTPETKYHEDTCHYRGHAEAAARISALEAALKPFADESEKFDTLDLSVFTHDEVELWQPGGSRRTHLTVGDLRRAKAALEV